MLYKIGVKLLLLLSGGSAGTIDGLLDLASKTILGGIELGANGTVLGERSTDLAMFVSFCIVGGSSSV